MDTTHTVGEIIFTSDLLGLPAGAEFERVDGGFRITSLPQVSERDALADALWNARYPERSSVQDQTANHDAYLRMADYVLSHYTRSDAHSPSFVVDGDGDEWYLKSDGLYSGSIGNDGDGCWSLDYIRTTWGIRSTRFSAA